MSHRHCAIVLLAAWTASCDPGNPTEPGPSTTPGQVSPATVQRIELAAPASIAPGASVQLTASAVRSDNSVENVSDRAQWRSSAPNVIEISPAGIARGIARGETFISVYYQSRSASTSTFVLPAGTFRLRGTVTDTGIPVANVSVAVIDGEDLTATTNADGVYQLYGVRDRVRLQATGSGYLTELQEVDVADHRTFDFEMRMDRPRTDVRGRYRLTIDKNPSGGSGCTGTDPKLPDTRSYDATVDQDGPRLTVTLSGADFIVTRGRGNTFSGAIDGSGRVTFVLGDQDLYYWEDRVQDLVERISETQVLVITGKVTADLSGSRISGTLAGFFLFVAGGGPPYNILRNNCYIFATHRFELVRQ